MTKKQDRLKSPMSAESVSDIMNRLRANDKTVLNELFQQHYNAVCQTIHRFIRDRSLVEDLAQNVFIRFWEKRQQVNIQASFKAYFHRMAINEALGWLRKNKGRETEEISSNIRAEQTYSVEDDFLQTELQAHVTVAINKLPPKCRTVFQLSRFEQLTYKEIAEKLGISVKTVENQMGKALKIMRAELKGYLK